MNNEHQDTRSAGKWMVALAWICGLGLLVFVFSDLLEKQVNPNTEPASQRIGTQTEVRLKQNRQGHYVTSGYINGEEVVFLVDTGATDVAVPAHLASKLQLQAGQARPMAWYGWPNLELTPCVLATLLCITLRPI